MTDTPKRNEAGLKVVFHYLKSHFFRVCHVDGIIGSYLPNGGIHMTAFSERPALPQRSEHGITTTGALGESTMTGKEGFVRELEVDLIMSRDVAVNMRDWLDNQIRELDARTSGSDQ